MERELKNVEAAMQNIGNSTRAFQDMLKATLSSEVITAGVKKLGDTIKGVKNHIMDGVQSAAKFGHEMSAISEKTGISTEVLYKI